jgi:hypothetical protein
MAAFFAGLGRSRVKDLRPPKAAALRAVLDADGGAAKWPSRRWRRSAKPSPNTG